MKIAVFCSANSDIEQEYFRQTEEFGAWAASQGHTIVYGGCDKGLMECVAKAAHEHGGMTVGVVPLKIEQGGHLSRYVSVEIPCDNLSDRKDLILAHADVAVALPGGIGTLDEIFTMAASATIGYHSKKVILFNMGGFWDALIALLDDMERRGMVRGDYRQRIATADTLEQLIAEINHA